MNDYAQPMSLYTTTPHLILASTSVYRRALLTRMGVRFQCIAPNVVEQPGYNEHPAATAQRLAATKALSIAQIYPQACVIGADQVACVEGKILSKPTTAAIASEQLHALSGRTAHFFTGVCVIHQEARYEDCNTTEVQLRDLSSEEIQRYLEKEHVLGCAGSFRAEGIGIGLFTSISTSDPTALIGLPLIATAELLRKVGFQIP